MSRSGARFLYSGIRVRNLARSIAFYRRLGFRILFRGKMQHGGEFVHLVFPGQRHRLELNYYTRGNRFYEPFHRGTEFDHFGFYVTDVTRWVAKARHAGGRIALDFREGRQRLVYVSDPDGVWIEFFGPAKPRRRRRSQPAAAS